MYSFRKVKGTRFLWLKFRNFDLSASMQVIRFHFFPAFRLRKRQFSSNVGTKCYPRSTRNLVGFRSAILKIGGIWIKLLPQHQSLRGIVTETSFQVDHEIKQDQLLTKTAFPRLSSPLKRRKRVRRAEMKSTMDRRRTRPTGFMSAWKDGKKSVWADHMRLHPVFKIILRYVCLAYSLI